jgi:ParB/RepB/Spo0J family partition protein
MENIDEVCIQDFKYVPLSQIEIANSNVRKTKQAVGLEELKSSIQKMGLIQPVVLIEKGKAEKYRLIVGQRRLLAFQELGKTEIPAIIIATIDPTTERVVSFGENIHRRALPYDDTIKVCDALFENSSGEKYERIESISKALGISTQTVSKYLSYRLVPDEVRNLVTEEKLSANVAYRITSAFWPNSEKIINIANYMTKMTKSEWERALNIGKRHPEIPAEEIITQAKKPQVIIELVIPLDVDTNRLLAKIAKERNLDQVALIRSLIDEFLEGEKGEFDK